jgi:RHS repeat-associated protein
VEHDGITPLNTYGEGIRYTITSTPRIGSGDTAPSVSRDGIDGSTRTWDIAPVDVGGFAGMYLYYGSVEGQYQVTVTTRFAPFEPQTFTLTASATGEGDPTDPKNLGKPDCVDGAGTAASGGRPTSVSNPINITTGNKYQEETDLIMPQPALLQFVRYYNSLEDKLNALGWNWRHDYDRSIEVVTTGKGKSATQTAYVTRDDGRVYTYTDINGTWVSDLDVMATLTQTATGWSVSENNVTETFDADGKLLSIQNLDGRTINLTYDALTSRLSQVTDDIGSSITFAYNAQGLISTITDQGARYWQFGYDSNNNLTSVTNPDSTVKIYHYDDPDFVHALTGITDERGTDFATYAYNTDGKAVASYHSGNAGRVDITYGTNGTRTVTNGRSVTSTYDVITQQKTGLVAGIAGPGCSSCSASDTQYYYDAGSNKLVKKVDKGHTTLFGAYANNSLPGYVERGVGTAEAQRTVYQFDPRFVNLPTTITKETVSGITGLYSTTNRTYDDYGNTTQVLYQGYSGDGQQALTPRQIDYTYDGPLHQLSQVDGPRTDVQDIWSFEYYPNDVAQGSNRARLKRVTGPGNQVWIDNIQYSATGERLSEQRPNGLQIAYSYYPGNDRLASVTKNGGGAAQITRWTYLPTGEVQTVTVAADTVNATTVTLEYDDARRLVGIRDGLNNLRRFELNSEGGVESEETYNVSGSLEASISRVFDDYNRLTQTATANEVNSSSYGTDGLVTQTIDGNYSATTYTYDGLQRITSTTQLVAGVSRTISYTYNSNADITSVKTPYTTSYDVDDYGDVEKVMSPDTDTTSYVHDAAGNVVSKQDALGRTTTRQYDGLNRPVNVDAEGTLDDLAYTYDSCTNGTGRLCSIQNGYSTVNYAYDVFGNITSHQGLGYQYDAAGRISGITYPSGTQVTYTFDAAGRIASVDASGPAGSQTLASAITYRPFGPVDGMTYGNGLPYAAQFDQAARLLNETVSTALSRTYSGYDGNGNLLNLTEQTGSDLPEALQFSYYEDDALDLAQGPFGVRDYDYSISGNRSAYSDGQQLLEYAYFTNPSRLSLVGSPPWSISPGAAQESGLYWCVSDVQCWDPDHEHTDDVLSMAYDAVGNTISRSKQHYLCETLTYDDPTYGPQEYYSCTITEQTDWTYAYSANNQIIAVTANHVPLASYEYNPLGQRTRKVLADGSATGYVYGLDGALLAELDDAGNPLVEYVYLNGKLLAVNDLTTSTSRFVHTDHLGTPKVMTDQSGRIVWAASHDPFGAAMVDEDPDGDGIDVVMNVRFPGQYYDSETGLHYNYFRYLDPQTGRYIMADPIGQRAGPNLYTYVFNNPARWVDPLGLDVTVCLYPGVPPHVGLDVNGSDTVGSRTDGTSGLTDIINGKDVPGEVSDDSGDPSDCTTTKTTPEQDEKVQEYIDNNILNPGSYNLYNRSCVDFVRDAYEEILDIPLSDTNFPTEIYSDIFFYNNR